MLLCLPRMFYSEDDSYAPVDYSYVGSVAEGARRQQGQAIHRQPDQAAVRHRADPNAVADEQPADGQAAPEGAPRGLEAARRMPRMGDPTPAASVAYPRPRENAFARTPAYAPESAPALPPEPERPAAAPRSQHRPPRDMAAPQRPQANRQPGQAEAYAPGGMPPPDADMPDWLRTARQNNMPLYDERRNTAPIAAAPAAPAEPPPTDLLGRPLARTAPPPPASATPMTAADYAAAGYPPELIAQKMSEDAALRSAMGVGRKRHGAQLAAPPPMRQARVTPAPPAMPAPDPWAAPAQAWGDNPPQAEAEAPRMRRSRVQPYAGATDAADAAYPAPAGAYPGAQGQGDALMGGYPQGDAPRRRVASRQNGEAPEGDAPNAWQQPPRRGYPPHGGYEPRVQADPYAQAEYAPRRQNPYQLIDGPEQPPAEDEPGEDEKPRLRIPYLGIATFAAALALVLLWILRLTYTAQTEGVLASRDATQAQLANKYPYTYRELIEREAAANNLHPAFVAAIVLNESSFDPKAESNVGARGLMQMMPDTAEWVHTKMASVGEYSFDLMYDPDTNVRYACWYLAYLSERFRADPVLVSAAFHAGQTTVQNWLNDSRYSADNTSIQLEKMTDGPTKAYATRVLKAFAAYRRLYYEGGLAGAPATGSTAGATTAAVAAPTL